MSQIIPRDTVRSLVASRDRRLALYAEAHAKIADASLALDEAAGAAMMKRNSYNMHSSREDKEFIGAIQLPDRSTYLDTARRLTDVDVWARIVEMTDLEKLMDKTAKDQLRQQLMSDPPEVTEENVFATLEQFASDAGTIFRRGIATAFSALDRRFRSHDGWKIGSRLILERALDENGYWNHWTSKRDTLQDIERVFFVLDGKQVPPTYAGIIGAIEETRRDGRFGEARQSETASDYFTARCFKNGNLHLWFKRDDLLAKVNRLIGEYYGAPIPEEREADEDTGLNTPKYTPAKRDGFFPTPPEAGAILIEQAGLYRREGDTPLTCLEPSAGTGNLASLAASKGCRVDCVEVQPSLAAGLKSSGRFRSVQCGDFLMLRPTASLYDRVIMNPPFDRERDIDHVMHALKFLKPDGILVAIMSAGTEFRETKKSTAFRAMMEKMGASWRDLPAGSFSSVGTNCNTVILKVRKDGGRVY